MTRKTWLRLYNAFRRRKAAESFSKFRLLTATPSDLGSHAAGASSYALIMPGGAFVGISYGSITTIGKIKINGSGVRAAAANEIVKGPYLHEGSALTLTTLNTLAAGTIKVYAFDEWSRPRQIAAGTVS